MSARKWVRKPNHSSKVHVKSKYVALYTSYSFSEKCAYCVGAIPATCSFDSSTCSFSNSEDLDGEWVRMKATRDLVDHTSGTENGESLHDWRISVTVCGRVHKYIDKDFSIKEFCSHQQITIKVLFPSKFMIPVAYRFQSSICVIYNKHTQIFLHVSVHIHP